jgi:hypothetical protein
MKPSFDHFCPKCEQFTMLVVTSKAGKLGRSRMRRCQNCRFERRTLETVIVPGLRAAIRRLRKMAGKQLLLPIVLLLAFALGCAKRPPSLGADWKASGERGCVTRDVAGEHTVCCPTHGKREYGGADYVCVTRDVAGRIVPPAGGAQ